MKKIYFISYFFAPIGRASGVNRTYFVKYLAKEGWDIDVFHCSNPHGFIQSFKKDVSLLKVIPDQIKVHSIPSMYWGPLGGIASLLGLVKDPFGHWQIPVIKYAKKHIKKDGIVYAVIPPLRNALIAYRIAQQKGMPLIIDFRDNVFQLPDNIIHTCKTIIASTEYSRQELQNHYNLPENFGHTMYNGFPITPKQVEKSHCHQDQLTIIYTGLLNNDQSPVSLPKALNRLEQKHPKLKGKIQIHYYGPKNYYTRLFLKKYLNEQVQFKGYLPFKKILKKIAEADVAYSSLNKKNNTYCIPSKIFQYIAMETPILAAGPKGALQELIVKHNIGRFSFIDNLEAQTKDLYHFYTRNDERKKYEKNIKKIKPLYAMNNQVRNLSTILQSIKES